MPFFDEKQGTIFLPRGQLLYPYMPGDAVRKALETLGVECPEAGGSGVVPFPAIWVGSGRVALMAFLEEDALAAVHLTVASIGPKAMPTAEQQRAFLFAALNCKDPCPDTRRPCQLNADFGTLILSADPRTGCAQARLNYR